MASMSYCKFENTYNDLSDCESDMDEDLSPTEMAYRKKLIRLCCNIANDYGHEIDS